MGENELKICHDIEHEKKLIELLGYDLIGPDNSNRWIILNEIGTQVGFIQYKKIYNGNKKKELPKKFAYQMSLPLINYNSTRKINNIYNKPYEFDIKRENGDIDTIHLQLGNAPRLMVWSNQYGFINFELTNKKLFVNFKSATENFNIEEVVIYELDDKNKPKEYTYQISYSSKENSNKEEISRIISGKNINSQGKIEIKEKTWVGSKLKNSKENEVIGTVDELALNHQMGIDAFNHFRFLISKILPFKQDIINAMVKEGKVNKSIMSMFISNNKKEEVLKELVKKI